MQPIVLAVSLIFMAVVASAFIAAIRLASVSGGLNSSDARRKSLIVALMLFGVVVTVASLWRWPHDATATPGSVVVNATGYQWYWEIDKEEVPVGTEVVFHVHTQDVTHGMGVADPSGRIIFQTQAMPGYVNKIKHTFSEPGEYKILCMEFCGVGHHDMIAELNVIAQHGEISND